MPVSLIAASAFGMDLGVLALVIIAPIVVGLLVQMAVRRATRRLVVRAVAARVVATALYDLCRGGFLWSGLIQGDPIPHIGTALGIDPAWAGGYTWRYLGNGTGLALTFLGRPAHRRSARGRSERALTPVAAGVPRWTLACRVTPGRLWR